MLDKSKKIVLDFLNKKCYNQPKGVLQIG